MDRDEIAGVVLVLIGVLICGGLIMGFLNNKETKMAEFQNKIVGTVKDLSGEDDVEVMLGGNREVWEVRVGKEVYEVYVEVRELKIKAIKNKGEYVYIGESS